MKKFILLTFLFLSTLSWSQNVYIPDANFKAALVGNSSINTNGDGEIQVSEASAYTGSIIVTSLNIANLTGIEAFTAITMLDCSYNQLTSLTVSANTALTTFYCNNNTLTSIDISANTALTSFDCSVNQLTSLNISANTALTTMGCNDNNITSLNLSTNTALTILVCGSNQLTSLNVSNNTALASLYCGNNAITSLNVSANTALTTLGCYYNQISALNLSANASLRYLNCQFNQLTALDVSANAALQEVRCYNNQLTSLNIKNGNNANFTGFNAQGNPNLTCIQVDNPSYMNATWSVGKDAGATFSSNCSGTGIAYTASKAGVTVYPNPSAGDFTLSAPEFAEAEVFVYDMLGNCVFKKDLRNTTRMQICLNDQPRGIYFIQLLQDARKKVIKIAVQ